MYVLPTNAKNGYYNPIYPLGGTEEITIWLHLRGTGISNGLQLALPHELDEKDVMSLIARYPWCEVPIAVGPLLRGSVPNDLSPLLQSIRKITPLIKSICKSPLAAIHRLRSGVICDVLYLMIATPCCQVSKIYTPSARY